MVVRQAPVCSAQALQPRARESAEQQAPARQEPVAQVALVVQGEPGVVRVVVMGVTPLLVGMAPPVALPVALADPVADEIGAAEPDGQLAPAGQGMGLTEERGQKEPSGHA